MHKIQFYHSDKFVNIAAKKPRMLKFISNELHNIKPSIIGNKLILVQKPVNSLIMKREIITVNSGDDDLIVSTNDTDEYLRATRQSIIDNSLLNVI